MAFAQGTRALLLSILLTSVSWAQAAPTTYQLEPAAGYTVGCFGACTCPLFYYENLGGSFELTFTGSTPDWFDHYAVDAVDWVLLTASGPIHITGSGQYDIGGPVALHHRLRLDLSFDGAAAKSFDSGLILGGSAFPRIDVDVSMHGMVCFDEVFEVRASPLTLGSSYCSSKPNSSGKAATLAATGSATVTDDDFSLVARHAPAGTLGIFFFGQGQQQKPFGDGFLCVASSIQRIPPALEADPSGAAWLTLDLSKPPAAGNLTPGSTWSFQFWFRDPLGGPSGFNLTDGLRVDFL